MSERIRAVLERHGLSVRRDLGQCFLTDQRVIGRIADSIGGDGPIVEIGPGLGALTEALVATGRPVTVVEVDRGMVRVLEDRFADAHNLRIIEGDARSVKFAELCEGTPVVVGNLPYSITSPLLLGLLAQRATIGSATVMIQREVARRLVATVGTKAYGSLSLLFQQHADVTLVTDVGPGSFWPAPSVHSSVLTLAWLPAPRVAVSDAAHFEAVVRAGFGQRRKTLRNALSARFPKPVVRAAGDRGPIDLSRRGETLTLEEFAALAEAIDLCGIDPSA